MKKNRVQPLNFEINNNPKIIQKLKREAIFTTAKPWKAIFTMVTPTIIAVLIFSTYQICDKLIATQWGGPNIISRYQDYHLSLDNAKKIINLATTYAAVPSSMMVAFALMVSTGTSVKFSIFYGKNDREKMNGYLGNGLVLSILTAIIFMITMYFACESIIDFQVNSRQWKQEFIKDIIVKEAVHFSRILILATPFLFLANFWIALIRSEGMMIWTILINVFACLVNLILDFILVIPFNMGMVGTVYATITAWIGINIMTLLVIYWSDSNIRFTFNSIKLKKILIAGILLIGATSLLQNIAQSILAMVTTRLLNQLPPPTYPTGDLEVPVYVQLYGGIMPWLILINAPIIGITQGARALVGYVYGMKDYKRLWQLMWRLTLLLILLLVASLFLVVAFGQYMMNAFGVDLALAKFFKTYIILQFAFYPLATLHYIAVIFYQSINRGKIALFASLQRTIITPIICLILGYTVAMAANDGFYFYLFIGFIDLFAAFVLLPLLLVTYFRTKPLLVVKEDNNDEKKVINVNTMPPVAKEQKIMSCHNDE